MNYSAGKSLLLYLTLILVGFSRPVLVMGQGCVPLRHYGGSCAGSPTGSFLSKNDCQAGVSYRYFKSFRHFRGDLEEHERIEEGTQVINHSNALDFSMNYGISNRVAVGLILPFVYNERSSLYEHGGNKDAFGNTMTGNRHSTFSRGISDVRVGISWWMLNPEIHTKSNVQLGVGIKLPTGEKQATDWFYNQKSYDQNGNVILGKRLLPVDQSIQPGDGGFGLTFEFNYFQNVYQRFSVYANGFYLVNPAATNGGVTRNLTTELSVPDQFSGRTGFSYALAGNRLFVSLGGRAEGIPSNDLVGSSEGYRRPGYSISAEPGIAYSHARWNFFANVPIALYRNRTKSYIDKANDVIDPAVDHHGDAAFSDFVIIIGATFRIPACAAKTSHVMDSDEVQ